MITKAVRLAGKHSLEITERNLELKDNEVLIKAVQSSICDADLRVYRGLHMPEDLPSFEWIGHEGGGEIVEIGKTVSEFKIGDKVMCFGPNNSWAEHYKANVKGIQKVPENLDMDIACLGEPTAVGMFGIFNCGVQLGDDACVIGLNYQGLLAVEGLKKRGARRLIAVDYSDKHLEMASKKGADVIINTNAQNAKEEILALTNGKGVDVVFHSCGYWNPKAEEYFNLGIDVIKDEGIFSSIPDMMSDIKVKLHRFHHHAIDVRFPALMHHNWEFLNQWVPRLLRPVADGIINVRDLITAEYSLNDIDNAITKFHEDPDQVKIIIKP